MELTTAFCIMTVLLIGILIWSIVCGEPNKTTDQPEYQPCEPQIIDHYWYQTGTHGCDVAIPREKPLFENFD